MSIKTESVGFFGVTISLGTFVEVIGGKTQLEVSQRKYLTKPAATQDLLKRILNELGAAIGDASPTIDLRIEDDKKIVDVVEKPRPASKSLAAGSGSARGSRAKRSGAVRKSKPSQSPTRKKKKKKLPKQQRKKRQS
jgi:hypothetical protein